MNDKEIQELSMGPWTWNPRTREADSRELWIWDTKNSRPACATKENLPENDSNNTVCKGRGWKVRRFFCWLSEMKPSVTDADRFEWPTATLDESYPLARLVPVTSHTDGRGCTQLSLGPQKHVAKESAANCAQTSAVSCGLEGECQFRQPLILAGLAQWSDRYSMFWTQCFVFIIFHQKKKP